MAGTPSRERQLIGGVWQYVTAEEGGGGGGGSLPTNVDWDENALTVHEASDSGPLTPNLFRLKTLLSGVLELSVKVAAYFTASLTTYNDNGDPLLESDSLANGGDGEVRISGQAVNPSGYQQTSEKGQADGYASLDSGGLVPTAQLPETPAVVPDVAYTEVSTGTTLLQGNVTASLTGQTIRWQRMGRTVHVRVYLQTETEGEQGLEWLVDLPEALPAIEYSGGSNGPTVVGPGYVVLTSLPGNFATLTALAGEDPGGPGPTRRLSFVTADGALGKAGADDRMGVGAELQLNLIYEAAAAA